jgi:CheY-like chemotaxis protein
MAKKNNQPKILLIDDEPALQSILKMKFEKEGYKFFGALTGEEGVKLAKEEKPDLILLDIIMPVKDGWWVFEQLKKMPETKKIKVVILSNSGREEDLEKGKKMGAVDYLIKTKFSLEEMMEKVKKCLVENIKNLKA